MKYYLFSIIAAGKPRVSPIPNEMTTVGLQDSLSSWGRNNGDVIHRCFRSSFYMVTKVFW